MSECYACGEALPEGECPSSPRRCGHHCNCSFIHDSCEWCGAETDDEGELVVPVRGSGQ